MSHRWTGPSGSGRRVAAVLLLWMAACQRARAAGHSAEALVGAEMAAWPHDCSERRLPAHSFLGACAEPRSALYESRDGQSHGGADASCAAAFDQNVSTFVEDVVLRTDRTVFGSPQPTLSGNPRGTYVGIDLHGHLVHLTGVSITPRPPNSDWKPRKHPYSTGLTVGNWTTTIAGARVQGSRDLGTWTDLYTFSGVLAPYPAATTFNFEAMTNGSCQPYSAFRLLQPQEHTRIYFANSEAVPVELTETYAVASVAELAFLGVRSLASQPDAPEPFINYTCLARMPASSVRLSPAPRRYPGAVNMSLVGPLRKCGAKVWYTLDGSLPRVGWSGGGVHAGILGNVAVSGGSLEQDETVRIISVGDPGTITSVHVRAFQEITCTQRDMDSGWSVELGFSSLFTSGFYTFPQTRLVPVCRAGLLAYPGDGMWCYSHHKLSEGKSFWDAEADCQRNGGNLASVSSAEENAFLARLARKNGTGTAGSEGGGGEESVAWLGLYRPYGDLKFRCVCVCVCVLCMCVFACMCV